VFLDLRFLLAILLRWMGRPATDSERARRGPVAVPGRIVSPGDGVPLSLTLLDRDHEASDFDLNRNEPLHRNADSWA
jgi:hypothetical protein